MNRPLRFLPLAFAIAAIAQTSGVATLKTPAAVAAPAHASVVADLTVAIQPGFHIQSNHPKLDYLIASDIAITPAGGIHATRVAWPAPQEHRFSFSDTPLTVFEGNVKVPVTLATGARGNYTLHGVFRYQACNDQLCRPPVNQPFTLAVSVR